VEVIILLIPPFAAFGAEDVLLPGAIVLTAAKMVLKAVEAVGAIAVSSTCQLTARRALPGRAVLRLRKRCGRVS